MKQSLTKHIVLTVLGCSAMPMVCAQTASSTSLIDLSGLGSTATLLSSDLTLQSSDGSTLPLTALSGGDGATGVVQGIVGGVPGLDGLNLSTDALANAFEVLPLEVIGALLSPNRGPSFSAQFDPAYTYRLPGLGQDEDELLAELPGLDGLPVALPR